MTQTDLAPAVVTNLLHFSNITFRDAETCTPHKENEVLLYFVTLLSRRYILVVLEFSGK